MPKPFITINNVRKSFGDTQVLRGVHLDIFEGEFLTLLGPSGCGKTTLLRIISGFEKADQGSILIDNHPIEALPPQQRNVHTVFQSYALFPHLNVFENVAFALRCKNVAQMEVEQRVADALRMVRLAHLQNRQIQQLSGGQQQRIAIARAIVNRPKVLLLDEPLSSLDYKLRKDMQRELKLLQQSLGITFIFVTHDQEEALSMSDRIVVFHQGTIAQVGTPREVYETPANIQVAQFIGEANVFDVEVSNIQKDHIEVTIAGVHIQCVKEESYQLKQALHLVIRPEDIRVWKAGEVESTKGMIPATIQNIVYKGSTVDLFVSLPSGKVVHATEFFDEDDEDLEYHIGQDVWIHWLTGWEVLLPYEA